MIEHVNEKFLNEFLFYLLSKLMKYLRIYVFQIISELSNLDVKSFTLRTKKVSFLKLKLRVDVKQQHGCKAAARR